MPHLISLVSHLMDYCMVVDNKRMHVSDCATKGASAFVFARTQKKAPPPPRILLLVESGACGTVITFLEELWIYRCKKTTS